MAPRPAGARDDGALEFATADPSFPRTDSRARLIPELRSRNISSFRAGWVERAGKSLGKPIIPQPPPSRPGSVCDRQDSPTSQVGASITSGWFHTPTCFGHRPAPILTAPHSGSWAAALMDSSQRDAGTDGGEADVEARGTATAGWPGQHRAHTIPPISVA